MAGDMANVKQRLEQVESGGMRYVESEPPSKPDARAVNADAMDPFTRRLWEDRTRDTPKEFGGDREPAYNIPERLYLKNDGTYAMLAGDARSRAYYVDKGFHCLSADEVAEYEKIKPGIVTAQRERAHLKTAIVQLVHTDAALIGHRDGTGGVVFDIDLMSADEMRAKWRALNAETTQPDRPLPPPPRWRSEGRDRQMAGVETTPPKSRMREFEAELEQAAQARRGGRDVEITPQNHRQYR
jgi:hypothetical protein